jgi:HEAT repeat protein
MMPTEELSLSLQQLLDPDASVRRSAAEVLAGADERAIYPLIRTLRDDNPGVQDAAMRSLIAIGGEVTAYMSLPLLRESPFLRNTARIILKEIGQTSVPLLRPLLLDKDDDVRTFALDLITEIAWCDYVPEVARLLETDPNQNTRASAARALGVLGDSAGLPALTAALRDNEWVCFSALESLAMLHDESAVDAVLALLDHPSETLRYAAIETLGKIGSPQSSAKLVSRLPRAADIEKTAIVRSLVQIGITPSMAEVADLLIEMFTRGEWEDRLVALKGLADLKDKRAVSAILDVAGTLDPSEPESEERLHAVKETLLAFGCVQQLLSVLDDPPAKFRSQVIAVEVIGQLQCPEAVPRLIAVLNGDLREVRRSAVLALAEIGGDAVLPVLRTCVDDRDGHVRNAAMSALGGIRDKNSFDHLLRHLAVENYKDVLEVNVRALLMISEQRVAAVMKKLAPAVKELLGRCTNNIDMLLALSAEPELAIRIAALAGLGRQRDDRARTRLAEALQDKDPEVRKAAVIALGQLNAVDELKKALGDKDMWVRLYAVKALGETGDAETAKAVIPLLYDTETPVVLSAVDALVQSGNSSAVALSALQNHRDERVRERITQITESLC